MKVGVVTFPGSLDDVDAQRAVRLGGHEAVALWHETGLTRPWNDPEQDLRRALAGPASTVLAALSAAGHTWRREQATALQAEQISINRIAALFGVTRQRISALLKEGGQEGAPDRRRRAAIFGAEHDHRLTGKKQLTDIPPLDPPYQPSA